MNVGQTRRAACGVGVAWVAALAAVAVLLAFSRYESRDPDSALHAAISSDLARRPFHEWIAPEWNGHWALEGLYREHPAGVFLFPAVVARLGYPSAQAAYAVNAIYQILTLWLMLALARQFLSWRESRVLVTLLLLLPIAFTYRIRANHEQPLLMCFLAACYGIERSRSSLKWAALSVAGFAGLFLVKGVFVAVAMTACAAWLAVRQWRWPEDVDQARPWIGLAVAVASLLLLVVAYEAAYASAVGERFFPWYSARQSGVALATGTAHPVRGALYSFSWYLGRIAWFTAPWSLAALVGCWRGGGWLRRASGRRRADAATHAACKGATLCVVVAVTYLAAFSVFERRADRYIFPAYYFLATWWAAYGLRLIPWLRRLAWGATRAVYPYDQVIVWFCSVLLALVAASWHLPNIKIWH